jgi:chemotaxis signal transduction protein
MTWVEQNDSCSCVLLRIGERTFALAADQVAELVAPSRIYRFPHRTTALDGVILRRGRVAVCDLAEKLTGKRLSSRRFYLIAWRQQVSSRETVAIPVSGECELIHADLTPAGPADSPHVAGWLSHNGEVIEILNLAALTPEIVSVAVANGGAEVAPEVRA